MLEQRRSVLVHAELDEGGGTETGVGGDGDSKLLAEVDEGLLGEVGVVLDLENGGSLLGVSEKGRK